MKLPSPLGVDTDILIYLLEGEWPDRNAFLESSGIGSRHESIASILAVGEVLVGRHRKDAPDAVARFAQTFVSVSGLTLVPDSLEIVLLASSIRASKRLQLTDSVHVATAISSGCAAFLTNDAELARRAAGLPIAILVLDELIAQDG